MWKCCIKEPPETGKKVLCLHRGDIYVAYRFKNYYLPIPFADHPYSAELCFPETWSEIDFPEGLTGHLRCMIPGESENMITFSEFEVDYPEEFNEFAMMLIESIGTLKKQKI